MVYKLDPLEVTLVFEHKQYRLGDTIDATVTLVPNSDIVIRKASLNLVVEGRRTEVKTGRAMGAGGASALQGGNPHVSTDFIPMQRTTEEKPLNMMPLSRSGCSLSLKTHNMGNPGQYHE